MVTMSLERKLKTSEKLGRFLGKAYVKTKYALKAKGGKAKEAIKKHSPAVKSAVKQGFLAGLAAARKIKIEQVKTRKKRRSSKKRTKKSKSVRRRRR